MRHSKIKSYWAFIISAMAWLAMDVASKHWAAGPNFEPVTIIDRFFYLSMQTNQGIAFGIFFGYIAQLVASVAILGILVYVGLRYWMGDKRKPFIKPILLGIIVGGAVGNLADRIRLGHVIDFIVLKPFPVFNVADIGITVGIVLLLLLTYRGSPK